jgi:hypothetical protein
VPVAKVTDRRHTGGELAAQRLADHLLDFFRRIPHETLQRHHPAVSDEVDMRVDQPGKHGRIAVVDQLTIGGRLVSHRFHPDNAALLHKDSAATGAEIFTVDGMGCTDREHNAWLSNPLAPVNALPCEEPA